MNLRRIKRAVGTGCFAGICILVLPLCRAYCQDHFFEGRITYQIREFDERGRPMAPPISREEMYVKETVCLTKPVEGQFLDLFDQVDTYLDAQKNVRYSINHTQHYIRSIGPSQEVTEYELLENRRDGEEQVQGQVCDVYVIKYAREYDALLNLGIDTLRCRYYVSKDLKMPHRKEFALLNGNRNSLLLDGRFEGIVLKLVIERKNKSHLEMIATEIKKMPVDEFIRLPDYPGRF